ncbi:hypothetical protein CVT24_011432 [Panaeolus cyanescens]|uniref:Uncharacterized protein n=1 Tax=Panaeolus cyanescens TaxID=181874 RepID=A0A409VGE2_9AGAR|nr:hypothetical protein CVT24_011432 [Panaeolus cyanescens]
MFVPFISKRSPESSKQLFKRKGGGGRGGARGGGGGSSGSARSSPVSVAGTSKSATVGGNGGGAPITIPAGQPFAGSTAGGGTRAQVYGSRSYTPTPSGFPFYFWPLAWGGAAGYGYGRYNDQNRPGGVMTFADFPSSSQNTTFRLLADKESVDALLPEIQADCSSMYNTSSSAANSWNETLTAPQIEQVIQYYRDNSIALTLDGFNTTGNPDAPLPSNIDTGLLNCLNTTIGEAAPLIDAASLRWAAPPNVGIAGLVLVIWHLSSSLI